MATTFEDLYGEGAFTSAERLLINRNNARAADLTSVQTLTNKTLTSPTVTGGSVSGQTQTAPVISAPSGSGFLVTKSVLFSETAAGLSHVGTIPIPAGAVICDIRVIAQALWGAAAAVLKVGDTADDDGYFTGVDLKATDLLVGEVLSALESSLWGGKEGAYLVAATGRRGPTSSNFGQYYVAGSNLIGTVTVTTPTPTTGRTLLQVTYSIGEVIAPVVT